MQPLKSESIVDNKVIVYTFTILITPFSYSTNIWPGWVFIFLSLIALLVNKSKGDIMRQRPSLVFHNLILLSECKVVKKKLLEHYNK